MSILFVVGITRLYARQAEKVGLFGLLAFVVLATSWTLPRVPAALLAIAATLTPLAALLPHAEQRYVAIPVALALAWLGYALWSERRAPAGQTKPATGTAQLRPATAK